MFENSHSSIVLCCWFLMLLVGCESRQHNSLFIKLSPSQSGIHFRNDIRDTDSSNSIINEFGYMGGGVGIGDFNNDGLKDIVFTANQVSSRLYLNKGQHRFEDITERAGLTTAVWATGVSIVDINADGWDDIYITTFGKNLLQRSKNLLFINQHDLTFEEQAERYGLADTGYSSQAAFFDYDRDGDLDMYLANYSFNNTNTTANNIVTRDRSGSSPANDRLYRNVGDSLGRGHPFFTDVTQQAGILEDGYGLGVTVSDLNNDGWPDVYVANDFVSNDHLWLNNQNGTFTNCIDQSMRHQSYSSMGVDVADLNNDSLADVVTLDMLPEYNERKKTSFFFMNYERYQAERFKGYEPQFARNMLQLNNGIRYSGDTVVPFFSETGQLAGISATDWSWSVLMADFNNDGWKDVHITNGVGRDFINADFLEFSSSALSRIADKKKQHRAIKEALANLDHIYLPNYLYVNNRDYTFRDVSAQAGIDEPSLSNGAAYADIDNDGDLDLVVNNINSEAAVFLNNTVQNGNAAGHFLKVTLRGNGGNLRGIGSKVCIYHNGRLQVVEQSPVRGYFSSVDQDLFFGLGADTAVDSVVVCWPNGKTESKVNVATDVTLTLFQKDAHEWVKRDHDKNRQPLFVDITDAAGTLYRHTEYEFNDFAGQRLLPQKFSQLGPYISSGDIDNDGSIDFFVGGASNFSGKVFLQKEGRFVGKNLGDSTKPVDDMDCLLFDADNDHDLDLIITAGDVQQPPNSLFYKPRLYLNDGKGNFLLKDNAIPDEVRTIAGSVSAADYDGDGDLDLFIGGRVSDQYPVIPRSFLLENNGGVFSDKTKVICSLLERPGMITASVWTDFDNDKQPDLIIAGEWMPVRFFKNHRGRLTETTQTTGLEASNGMWRSLAVADIDRDGDLDVVAGNLGLNCTYQATAREPMQLYAKDLDGNGSIDPVFFYYIRDKSGKRRSYPGVSRSQLADQVPAIKKQFLYARDYARASFDDIFRGNKKEGMLHFTCHDTRSCYFENLGDGKFQKRLLPMEAQIAPINAILCDDFDGDGYIDLLMAGNEYQTDVITGRYDASYGWFLKGGPDNKFRSVSPAESGFILDGDIKDMELVSLSNGEKIVIVASNNDSLRTYRLNKQNGNLTRRMEY